MCAAAKPVELRPELMIAALAAHPVALEKAFRRNAQGAKWPMTGSRTLSLATHVQAASLKSDILRYSRLPQP